MILSSQHNSVFNEVKNPIGDVYITIIDGQHRIKGIEVAIKRLRDKIDSLIKTLRQSENSELQERLDFYQARLNDLLNIELLVSFFIDKTLEFQAMIFSTINRTQKRVSQNLVYSLFGLTTDDSPQKTALEIVLALNSHPKSPFYNRKKILIDIITYEPFDIKQISIDYFSRFLSLAADTEFENQQIFPFSTKGKNILYLTMSLKILSKSLPEDLRDERKNKLNELMASI